MPDALVAIVGWVSLVLGVIGLGRGATLVSRGGPARDSIGTPGWIVLVESGGLTLMGTAVLSGGGWVHLIWPAAILMTIGIVTQLRDRRSRPRSHATRDSEDSSARPADQDGQTGSASRTRPGSGQEGVRTSGRSSLN